MIEAIYAVTIGLIAVFGAHLALMLVLAAWPRRPRPAAAVPYEWPAVLVQLPIFNERYVVERLIDAAAALDYPSDRLTIQVLDDSTDDTSTLARARVAQHRARGKRLVYLHRQQRAGFKAGALAFGLANAPAAESRFVAVFDADFAPPPDFLRRLVPDFLNEAGLGLVQARWEHLNPAQNLVTRTQALAYDGYFTVDQVARARAGLLMNFNGSAGVWRRACIESAGGWQGDTLAEDLDLSYRAQLRGWRLDYRPEVTAPAELPPSLLALKRQQFRWAKGSFQVLGKLGPELLQSPLPLFRKALGLLHLAGYLPHPLMVLSLLLSLPVVLGPGRVPFHWEALSWLGLVPPLVTLWGQMRLRRADWARGLAHYPPMALGMIGLALNNTRAFVEACLGMDSDFKRTPKFSARSAHEMSYALPLDWTTGGEIGLALYALVTGLIALARLPGLAPVMFLYALAFGYTAALSLWESGGMPQTRVASQAGTD